MSMRYNHGEIMARGAEPDQEQRFFRMGTDPSAMYDPIAVDFNDPTRVLSKWGTRKRRV